MLEKIKELRRLWRRKQKPGAHIESVEDGNESNLGRSATSSHNMPSPEGENRDSAGILTRIKLFLDITYITFESTPWVEEDPQVPQLFSSSLFTRRLPHPVPVEDIFFNAQILCALRIVTRPAVFYFIYFWVTSYTWVIPSTLLIRFCLLRLGVRSLLGVPIPTKRRILRALIQWNLILWASDKFSS